MKAKPKNVDEIVNNLTARFQGTIRSLLQDAINDGARIGGEEMKKKVFSSLAQGEVLNDLPPRKRDKTPKGNVKCPVAGCKRPGIRPLRNFCQVDYDRLPAEKREELRKKQIDEKKRAAG